MCQSSQISGNSEAQQFTFQDALEIRLLQNILSCDHILFIPRKKITCTIGISGTHNITGTISVTSPQKQNALSTTCTESTALLQKSAYTSPPPPTNNNQLPESLTIL